MTTLDLLVTFVIDEPICEWSLINPFITGTFVNGSPHMKYNMNNEPIHEQILVASTAHLATKANNA